MRATGAKLMWASSTPIPLGPERDYGAGAAEAIVALNRIAAQLMSKEGIVVDDLHRLVLPKISELQKPNDCHFTDAGNQTLGEIVGAAIDCQLKR